MRRVAIANSTCHELRNCSMQHPSKRHVKKQ
jgi:hypothetical protein